MIRLFVLLGALGVFCLAGLFVWDMYTKATLSRELHRDLGFELAYVRDDAFPGQSVKRFDYVAPEGVFATAGFLEGDIIVDDLWLGQFYRMLHRSRGTPVTINVVRRNDGPPLALTFTVPEVSAGSGGNGG